jgi:hypothetical protein
MEDPMKHREIDYQTKQLADGSWQWTILPKGSRGRPIISQQRYATQDDADQACKDEIDRGLAETSA